MTKKTNSFWQSENSPFICFISNHQTISRHLNYISKSKVVFSNSFIIFKYWECSYTRGQNFRKTNISYPLIRVCTCAYQGVRKVSFSENLAYVLNEWSPLFFHLIEIIDFRLNQEKGLRYVKCSIANSVSVFSY